MTWLCGIIVALAGLWLIGLGGLCVVSQERARQLLHTFASSARAHYTEQSVRLVAGVGFVGYAPQMRFSPAFSIFGWVLIATSLALLPMPWRWHHRFGQWAIPLATRFLGLYAIAALALGVFVLFAAWPWGRR